VTWWEATRIMIGVGDLMQMTGDGQAQARYSVAERSGGRVKPCPVYTVHIEMRSVVFLVWPQNQGPRVSWFGLKTNVDGFPNLCLKTGSSSLVI
jgi:hypothetical protein